MAEVKNGSRWFAVAMFLAGVTVSGSAGVIRSDWVGEKAAESVKIELKEDIVDVKEDIQKVDARWEKRMDRFEAKLDEALQFQSIVLNR